MSLSKKVVINRQESALQNDIIFTIIKKSSKKWPNNQYSIIICMHSK